MPIYNKIAKVIKRSRQLALKYKWIFLEGTRNCSLFEQCNARSDVCNHRHTLCCVQLFINSLLI